MSINLGYFPAGSVPAVGRCPPAPGLGNSVQLPDRFQSIASHSYCADRAFGFDSFARAALEAMRNGYNPLPTSGVREFGSFFSEQNYNYLYEEIKKRAGFPIDRNELFDVMLTAYSMILPRSDPTDILDRTRFTDDATSRYVNQLNQYVLEQTVEEVKQANKLWDFYAANRNGPSEFPEHLDTDTRTRLVGSMYAMDYFLP